MRQTEGVIMVHIGRSGSTVLTNQLDQNDEVEWQIEPFERLAAHNQRTLRQKARWMPLRVAPFTYLDWCRKRCERRFYGFDIKFYHLTERNYDLGNVLSTLRKRGFTKVISLKRKNFLRKIVSSASALQDDLYHLGAEEEAKNSSIRIDPDAVLIDGDYKGLIERFEIWDNSFNRLEDELSGFDRLQLTYEDDILPDPKIGYKRVCEYLGLHPKNVSILNSRTTTVPLTEKVENWEEVCQALKVTKWEWMLDDGLR